MATINDPVRTTMRMINNMFLENARNLFIANNPNDYCDIDIPGLSYFGDEWVIFKKTSDISLDNTIFLDMSYNSYKSDIWGHFDDDSEKFFPNKKFQTIIIGQCPPDVHIDSNNPIINRSWWSRITRHLYNNGTVFVHFGLNCVLPENHIPELLKQLELFGLKLFIESKGFALTYYGFKFFVKNLVTIDDPTFISTRMLCEKFINNSKNLCLGISPNDLHTVPKFIGTIEWDKIRKFVTTQNTIFNCIDERIIFEIIQCSSSNRNIGNHVNVYKPDIWGYPLNIHDFIKDMKFSHIFVSDEYSLIDHSYNFIISMQKSKKNIFPEINHDLLKIIVDHLERDGILYINLGLLIGSDIDVIMSDCNSLYSNNKESILKKKYPKLIEQYKKIINNKSNEDEPFTKKINDMIQYVHSEIRNKYNLKKCSEQLQRYINQQNLTYQSFLYDPN
jgi:hypothetical protein